MPLVDERNAAQAADGARATTRGSGGAAGGQEGGKGDGDGLSLEYGSIRQRGIRQAIGARKDRAVSSLNEPRQRVDVSIVSSCRCKSVKARRVYTSFNLYVVAMQCSIGTISSLSCLSRGRCIYVLVVCACASGRERERKKTSEMLLIAAHLCRSASFFCLLVKRCGSSQQQKDSSVSPPPPPSSQSCMVYRNRGEKSRLANPKAD